LGREKGKYLPISIIAAGGRGKKGGAAVLSYSGLSFPVSVCGGKKEKGGKKRKKKKGEKMVEIIECILFVGGSAHRAERKKKGGGEGRGKGPPNRWESRHGKIWCGEKKRKGGGPIYISDHKPHQPPFRGERAPKRGKRKVKRSRCLCCRE